MFKAVIPARFASNRLPGKPLLDIAGKPMVVRVAEQAMKSRAEEVLVATDHKDIFEVCRQAGLPVLMTQSTWPTGTDRLSEVAQLKGWDDSTVVVNVQGDEPLIDPELINTVADALLEGKDAIATCAHPIEEWQEFSNPNVVKVVCNAQGQAIYFSRAPIPFPRDIGLTPAGAEKCPGLRHVGLYAYRCSFLKDYPKLPEQSIEQLESLEQLRALACGYSIKVCMIQAAPPAGVDTEADLVRVRHWFESLPG
ncbi:MAG: 3-deoxy-manno-octulosonate cytidylyltransferase [Limnobacter sp.]|nr:3-deoxy-manno-octulosonate cytidylyltransferase [Limnobacter sp.]